MSARSPASSCPIGVAIVQFWPDWTMIVATLGIFVFGQFVEGNILSPKLVGDSVGLHPVWLMFALLAFGSLFGFVGLLLAVPLAAAIGVIARFALQQYLDKPALPRGPIRPVSPPKVDHRCVRRPSSSPSTCRSIRASAARISSSRPSNEQAYARDRELAGLARHGPGARRVRGAAARAISRRSGRRPPTPGPSTPSRSRRTRCRIWSPTARSSSRTSDRADRDEAALFHLLNLARERRAFVLLTCEKSPDHWGLSTADLLSRLRLAPSVSIGAPDDALLKAVLVKLFVDRQLVVDTSVVDYIALRIERSLAKADELVDGFSTRKP